ncbi:hypothetical protein BLNAU_23079 [Blattamonas nauphoetae]|uniref:Uncharacterized protein n=1 Tax=Blattamonas nauphoetae TaxID=2049346 RepID=A0ABQ9WR95_9EUKA|nr:hypothetical protein BLNAU_23079 [Blattamonas nauphoetae]
MSPLPRRGDVTCIRYWTIRDEKLSIEQGQNKHSDDKLKRLEVMHGCQKRVEEERKHTFSSRIVQYLCEEVAKVDTRHWFETTMLSKGTEGLPPQRTRSFDAYWLGTDGLMFSIPSYHQITDPTKSERRRNVGKTTDNLSVCMTPFCIHDLQQVILPIKKLPSYVNDMIKPILSLLLDVAHRDVFFNC